MGIKSERINKVKELTSSVSGSSARLITNENFKLLSRAIVDIIDELDIDLINNIHINDATLDGTLNTSLGLNVNNGNFTVNAMGQMFAQGGIYTPLAHISRLRLDPDTNPAAIQAGEIRWTGSDFVGWTGSTWESFLNGGGGSSGFFPNGLEIVTVSRDFQSSDAGKRLMLSGTDISVTMPAINPFDIGDYVGIVSDGIDCAFNVENGGDLIYPLKTGDGSTSECVILMNTVLDGDQWLLPISTSFIYDNADSKKKTALKHLYDNIRTGTGTPTEIVYIDNAGVGTSDALATRDSVTNETYIGYRTSGGDFSNALKLGNFIGSFITDGTGFERHDAVNDNFTFSAAIDGTPISATTNTLLQGYADLTNGVFATGTYNADGVALDYGNNIIGMGGSVSINDTDAYMVYGDGSTFQSYLSLDQNQAGFQYTDIGSGRIMENKVDQTRAGAGNFDGTGNYMSWQLDDFNRYFNVFGLYNSVTDTYGDMLKLDASTGIMGMGDVGKIDSNIGIFANNSNGTAYITGLASPVVNWTPSTLSDGFIGTGLNDMHYDSTITYTGSYPRTYTSTISATDCVYLLLTSIISPSFNFGDTVTDPVSGSTGTVVAGSDLDLYLIIQPIIDSGWNTATQVDDITTGGSANCSFQRYTDTFDWNDGTTFETYRDTNTFVFPLNNGLTVGFYSPTGHTIGDTWEFKMIQGTVYSKMALFDGVNRTMSIGDVEQTVNDVRTDWVLGTGKNHGIYEYLGDAQEYHVSNSVGNLLVLDSDTFNQTVIFSIEDPFNGQTPFSVETDDGAYGFGFQLSDAGQHYATLGAPTASPNVGNNTFLNVNDDTETITLAASHISAPLSAYADDADAGTNGVVTGELYQTDGTGSAPLNIAGIVMIKQ